jgi:hypothetical protein
MLPPVAWGTGYGVLTAPDSLAPYLGQTHGPTTLPAFGAQKSILLAGQSNAGMIVEPKLGAYQTLVIKSWLGATSLQNDWYPGSALFNAAVAACYATTPVEYWWGQGESDAANQQAANDYDDNLWSHIAGMRIAFNLPNLFVRVVQLHIQNPGTYRDIVRAAQNAVCDADPYAEIFNIDGYALQADSVHLTAAAGTQVGVAMGNAYIATL